MEIVVVLESMKMEFTVAARVAGVVQEVYVGPGDAVRPGDRLVLIASGSGVGQ